MGDSERTEGSSGGGFHLRNAWIVGLIGAGLTGGLAALDMFWPALTLLAGVIVTSGLMLSRRDGTKQYVLSGVVFCLSLAFLLEAGGTAYFGADYIRVVLPAIAGLGAFSGILVFLKIAGKRIVKRIAEMTGADKEYLQALWETLAAIGSLLALAWLLLTFAEKVVRYAGVSVGALTLLLLNALGVSHFITVLGIEFEAITTLFVGCLLLWFHLLDSLHSMWRTTKMTAKKGTEVVQSELDATSTDNAQ